MKQLNFGVNSHSTYGKKVGCIHMLFGRLANSRGTEKSAPVRINSVGFLVVDSIPVVADPGVGQIRRRRTTIITGSQ